MAERCPDCGLVQKSPPPYSSGCYCDYHCVGGKLCEERSEHRTRIAQLETVAAWARKVVDIGDSKYFFELEEALDRAGVTDG